MAWPTVQEVVRPLPVEFEALESEYQGVNSAEVADYIRVWIERTGWAATADEPADSDLARDVVLQGARADSLVQLKVYRDEDTSGGRDLRREAYALLKRLEEGEDVPGGDENPGQYAGEMEVSNFTETPLWDNSRDRYAPQGLAGRWGYGDED